MYSKKHGEELAKEEMIRKYGADLVSSLFSKISKDDRIKFTLECKDCIPANNQNIAGFRMEKPPKNYEEHIRHLDKTKDTWLHRLKMAVCPNSNQKTLEIYAYERSDLDGEQTLK